MRSSPRRHPDRIRLARAHSSHRCHYGVERRRMGGRFKSQPARQIDVHGARGRDRPRCMARRPHPVASQCRRRVDSPRPVPRPTGLVVKNGRRSAPRSWAVQVPVAFTASRTPGPATTAAIGCQCMRVSPECRNQRFHCQGPAIRHGEARVPGEVLILPELELAGIHSRPARVIRQGQRRRAHPRRAGAADRRLDGLPLPVFTSTTSRRSSCRQAEGGHDMRECRAAAGRARICFSTVPARASAGIWAGRSSACPSTAARRLFSSFTTPPANRPGACYRAGSVRADQSRGAFSQVVVDDGDEARVAAAPLPDWGQCRSATVGASRPSRRRCRRVSEMQVPIRGA